MSLKPVVTDAHLQAAFAAMKWRGITFEQAMQQDVRARIVRARAMQLARKEMEATHSRERVLERRQRPDGTWTTWVKEGGFSAQTAVPGSTSEPIDTDTETSAAAAADADHPNTHPP